MPLAERLLNQEKKSKEKLYSLCHPEVECISKGKAYKKYEFGCKAALLLIKKACVSQWKQCMGILMMVIQSIKQ